VVVVAMDAPPKNPRRKKSAPILDFTSKEPSYVTRYGHFVDPDENSADEERHVQRKFARLRGVLPEEEGMDFSVFLADMKEKSTPAPSPPPPPPPPTTEYMTGFVQYIVYGCFFASQPIGSLAPPNRLVDGEELYADKMLVARAVKEASEFQTRTLKPHASALGARLAEEFARRGNPELAAFHARLVAATGASMSVHIGTGGGVNTINAWTGQPEHNLVPVSLLHGKRTAAPPPLYMNDEQAQLFLYAHQVYAPASYIRLAVREFCGDFESEQEEDDPRFVGKGYREIWDILNNGPIFTKRIEALRVVITQVTRAWLSSTT
jgi:hypothetical protein